MTPPTMAPVLLVLDSDLLDSAGGSDEAGDVFFGDDDDPLGLSDSWFAARVVSTAVECCERVDGSEVCVASAVGETDRWSVLGPRPQAM